VARHAGHLRDRPRSGRHVDVALLADDSEGQVLRVGEREPIVDDHVLRRAMAGTSRDRLAARQVLEVAEEARLPRNLHVRPLHDLRVARGATELHAPHLLAEMMRVIELDPLHELDRPLDEARLVAATLQTVRVGHLGPRDLLVRSPPVAPCGENRLESPVDLRTDARRKMTRVARDFRMARSLPALDIGFLEVTVAAKTGPRREVIREGDQDGPDEKEREKGEEEPPAITPDQAEEIPEKAAHDLESPLVSPPASSARDAGCIASHSGNCSSARRGISPLRTLSSSSAGCSRTIS